MLKHYSHIRMEAKREALDAVGKRQEDSQKGAIPTQDRSQECADARKVEGESLQKSLQSGVSEAPAHRKAARKPLKRIGSSGRTRTYNPSVNSRWVRLVVAGLFSCQRSVRLRGFTPGAGCLYVRAPLPYGRGFHERAVPSQALFGSDCVIFRGPTNGRRTALPSVLLSMFLIGTASVAAGRPTGGAFCLRPSLFFSDRRFALLPFALFVELIAPVPAGVLNFSTGAAISVSN